MKNVILSIFDKTLDMYLNNELTVKQLKKDGIYEEILETVQTIKENADTIDYWVLSQAIDEVRDFLKNITLKAVSNRNSL